MKYAGQKKVSADIDKAVKKAESQTQAAKETADTKRKLLYYNKFNKPKKD